MHAGIAGAVRGFGEEETTVTVVLAESAVAGLVVGKTADLVDTAADSVPGLDMMMTGTAAKAKAKDHFVAARSRSSSKLVAAVAANKDSTDSVPAGIAAAAAVALVADFLVDVHIVTLFPVVANSLGIEVDIEAEKVFLVAGAGEKVGRLDKVSTCLVDVVADSALGSRWTLASPL